MGTETKGLIIVGAGPAGLSAAIAAARGGQSVLVLEKNTQPGRKLLLAGGGRANLIAPASSALNALEAYGRSGRFLRQVLASFSLDEFLEKLGVATELEKEGLRSGSVYVRGGSRRLLDALLSEARRYGAEILSGAAVCTTAQLPDGGFEMSTAHKAWKCRRLIIATGGITYPSTGSSGDGYRMAEIFGHKVDVPRPALCTLVTEPNFPGMAGVSVADASMTLRLKKRKLAAGRGALLFTHHGVSGPSVLDMSLELARALSTPDEISGTQFAADLFPDMSREQLIEEFLAASRDRPKRRLQNAGLIPALSARLRAELGRRSGIDPSRCLGQISRREFAVLAGYVKALTMTIYNPIDPNLAMVTVGGGVDPASRSAHDGEPNITRTVLRW